MEKFFAKIILLKMKKSIIYILFIAVLACNSSDDNRTDIIKQMVDEVSYLSSDELEGRETGNDGEKKAAEYISSKFLEYGLIGKGTDGFLQTFEASIKENPHTNTIKKKIYVARDPYGVRPLFISSFNHYTSGKKEDSLIRTQGKQITTYGIASELKSIVKIGKNHHQKIHLLFQ